MKKENSVFYEGYVQEWLDEEVPKEIDRIAQEYINGKRTLIWQGDMDADGNDEYFIVEKYPDVHHAVTKAVIVDRTGRLLLSVDSVQGVKSAKGIILDYRRLGLRDGEVVSQRLIFTADDIAFTKNQHKKALEVDGKNIFGDRYINYGGSCFIQLLDENNSCIGYSTFIEEGKRKYYSLPVFKSTMVFREKVTAYFVLYRGGTDRVLFDNIRNFILNYRKEKADGILHKVP